MPAIQTASRGRKQCPKCNTFNGVRLKVCGCGYSFESKSADNGVAVKQENHVIIQANQPESEPRRVYFKWGGGFVHAAAGECPIVPEDLNRESIEEFCATLINKRPYAAPVLKRWLTDLYPSTEWNKLRGYVDDYMLKNGFNKEYFQIQPTPWIRPKHYE